MIWNQITNVNNKSKTEVVLAIFLFLVGKKVLLTTVRLLLIRLVLAVAHAITGQGVVNAVSISALKLINAVTCSV